VRKKVTVPRARLTGGYDGSDGSSARVGKMENRSVDVRSVFERVFPNEFFERRVAKRRCERISKMFVVVRCTNAFRGIVRRLFFEVFRKGDFNLYCFLICHPDRTIARARACALTTRNGIVEKKKNGDALKKPVCEKNIK